jgi:ubiquitin C-terminal hydrolase
MNCEADDAEGGGNHIPPTVTANAPRREDSAQTEGDTASVSMYPPRLLNHRNTCFAGSLLQCLMSVPSVQRIMQHWKGLPSRHGLPDDENESSGPDAPRCLLHDLVTTIGLVEDPLRSDAVNIDRIMCSHFQGNMMDYTLGSQADAHEFFKCLVTLLEQEEEFHFGTQQISSLFKGHTVSKTVCNGCFHMSTTRVEPFEDVGIELWNDDTKVESLDHSVSAMQKPELVEEFRCEKCQHVGGGRCIHIRDLPEVLVFHIKRFRMTATGGRKLQRRIKFGIHAISPDHYYLKSFLIHVGEAPPPGDGHYVSVVNEGDARWVLVNDDHRYEVEKHAVMAQSAYMLFYVRRPLGTEGE